MNQLLQGLVLATSAITLQAGASDALVHLEIHEPPAAGRKPLDMQVGERERNEADSVIEVVLTSGASVPSSKFVKKAACAVTEARGERFFRSEPIPGPTTRYRLTFPRDAAARIDAQGKPAGIAIEQCRLVGF